MRLLTTALMVLSTAPTLGAPRLRRRCSSVTRQLLDLRHDPPRVGGVLGRGKVEQTRLLAIRAAGRIVSGPFEPRGAYCPNLPLNHSLTASAFDGSPGTLTNDQRRGELEGLDAMYPGGFPSGRRSFFPTNQPRFG